MVARSATSTTNSERDATVKAFVTLRIAGDQLAPEQVTRILKIVPTQAYRKGEHYSGGPHSPDLVGRTGLWYFSTDRIVAGNRLSDHLAFIERLVRRDGNGVMHDLQQLLRRQSLRVVVTCFWHGAAGTRRPAIPRAISATFKAIPAEIETDFDVDETPDRHAA